LSAIVTRPFLTRHELIQATDLSHDAANTAVAALLQAIGEPGTQLTMRTFHTGGVTGHDITMSLPGGSSWSRIPGARNSTRSSTVLRREKPARTIPHNGFREAKTRNA